MQARRMTFLIVAGVAPGNTRRSSVRSSGGTVSAIITINSLGTATHRRAAMVFPPRTRNGDPALVDVAPLERVEFSDAHPRPGERLDREPPLPRTPSHDRGDGARRWRFEDYALLSRQRDALVDQPPLSRVGRRRLMVDTTSYAQGAESN